MNKYIYDDGGKVIIMPITTIYDRHKYYVYPPCTIEGINEEIILVNKIREIPLTYKLMAVPITIIEWERSIMNVDLYEMPYSVEVSYKAIHLPAYSRCGKRKLPYCRFLIKLKNDWLYKYNN